MDDHPAIEASRQMDAALFHAFVSLVKVLHRGGAIHINDLVEEMERSTDFAQAALGISRHDLELHRTLLESIQRIGESISSPESAGES